MNEQYKQNHKLAKLIVFFVVVMLLVLNRHYDAVYLDIAAVFVWFFGVNPVGYTIETLRKHAHMHDKV